jgi:hypothetical protein
MAGVERRNEALEARIAALERRPLVVVPPAGQKIIIPTTPVAGPSTPIYPSYPVTYPIASAPPAFPVQPVYPVYKPPIV